MGKVGFLSPCDFKELGVAKRSLSTTSARSALRQPWSIIARTNFLKAATNLNVVQPKLFQASRQDDLRFSDCTVSVIQILDDADAAFRHLGRGIADRSIRDHHVRRQAAQPLTILPPVAALAVGLPAQRAIAQRFSPTCAESEPFSQFTEIGASRIKGLRPAHGRFRSVVPTLGIDEHQATSFSPQEREKNFSAA